MLNMSDQWFARISNQEGSLNYQPLIEHLEAVANKAASYAADFDSRDWGYLSGLWHDLGKYQHTFQEKLSGHNINVEHSGVGAALAFNKFGVHGLPISFVIAGHHTGLANRIQSLPDSPTPLRERIETNIKTISFLKNVIPPIILDQRLPQLMERFTMPSSPEQIRSFEFWIRFLFSCLVDADRLDAEHFDNPNKNRHRLKYDSLTVLNIRLDSFINSKIQSISNEFIFSEVNKVRQQVLRECQERACSNSGIFSITVPTGGGKTLSTMSFAIKHAIFNNMKRIIVVIPYTSIIEQNASEYKKALGSDNVIEHHSAYDVFDDKTETEITKYQMATENWDAPVIITTTVQFFESLFTSQPSKCRKLHNIARSVIILDEVQTLPPGYLESILEAINELASNYGCSIVLSTATQPALAERDNFKQGLKRVYSIISEPQQLTDRLKRVEYFWPKLDEAADDWSTLAKKIVENRQVMAIVDRRNDARNLTYAICNYCNKNTVFHLSALMCPAHRLNVLNRIKEQLYLDKDCRVISTQLVEAGVDLDFPVVFRALAGLTSIIQAAGRCNREGKPEKGKLFIFKPLHEPPVGVLRTAKQITESMLQLSGSIDLYDLSTVETFFKQLYYTQDLDAHNIQPDREQLNFANVDRHFQLIEDDFSKAVIVPYGDAINISASIKAGIITKQNLRWLQLFTVNIYRDSFIKLSKKGAIEQIAENIFAITDPRYYDPVYGLIEGDEILSLKPLIL